MKQLLLTLAILSLSFTLTMSSQAQTAEIDSLRGVIPTLNGNDRLDASFELAQRLSAVRQWDQSQAIFDSLFELALEDQKWEWMIKSSNELGKLYGMKGDIDASKQVLYRATEIAAANNIQTESIGITYFNLAASYYQNQKYDSSLVLLKKARNVFETLDISHRLTVLSGLEGIIYQNIGAYKMAAESYFKQVDAYKMTDSLGLGMAYQNLGQLYAITDETPQAEEYMQKAIATYKAINQKRRMLHAEFNYYTFARNNNLMSLESIRNEQLRGLRDLQELNDSPVFLVSRYYELGILYQELSKYDSSEIFLRKSLQINQQAKRQESTCRSLLGLARLYIKMGQLRQADLTLQQAQPLLDSLGHSGLFTMFYDIKAHLSVKRGNYDEFDEYYQLSNNIKDSLNTANRLQELDQLPIIYETEQKEAELALSKERLAKEEASAQRNLAVAGGAGILALVIGGGLYRTRQLNNRLNETNNQLIESNGALNSKTEELQATTEELRATLETNEKLRKASEGSAELLKTEKSYLTFLKDTEVELLENSEKNMKLKSGALVHDLENESSKKALRLKIDYKQAYERLLQRLEFSVAKFEGNLPSVLTGSLEKQVFPILKGLADEYQLKKELQINADLQFPDSISLSPKKAAYLYEAAYELGRNAIKHAFQDTAQPQLNFKLWAEEDSVFFSVSDNGSGLPDNFDLKKRSTLKTVRGPLKSNESLDYKTSDEGASFLITLKI